MEFKAGDRVHVTRICGFDTDFYATLSNIGADICQLKCSTGGFENRWIFLPSHHSFGPDKKDYYTLATDEEDTEEPEVQRISDVVLNTSSTKFIEKAIKDNLNRIEEIMNNDVPTHYKADIDVIEFCRQHFTDEEFKGAMKFNLIKYPTRLGRKDDMVKELDKIIDYAQRYKEVLER
ncbi:DUF3310 domain-containing protein [Staphylococcus sciuri]|uniref:DUF3310 domain-containing protein n=1 Tax=Mammaliicoccus sciuri TaxID=1296 RepID=UPI0013E90C91|nr:DUF3310 domain-containing protein [Mammaliicoccus sciuri]NGX76426.1 DUF3310 domain-containing protein [Mammaliicoccus sciuri]